MKTRLLISACALFVAGYALNAQNYTIASPDGSLVMTVHNGESLTYELSRQGKTIIAESLGDFEGEEMIEQIKNTTGNPGMATGGSGDSLTGIIVSLMGQGLRAFDAARAGAYIHGMAGDLAAEKLGEAGLISSDIVNYIAYAIKKIKA